MSSGQWIELNVGGKTFATTLNTVLSIPDTMLAKLCDPNSGFSAQKDKKGRILIDRDPKYFRVVLNYMRTGTLLMDNQVNAAAVLEEARFYQILPLEEAVISFMSTCQVTQRDFILHREELQKSKLKSVRLAHINLSGFNLCGFDFESANLSGADLSFCKLQAAVFLKCNASNTKFDGSILDKTELQHAILNDSSFKGCKFSYALLQRAQLRNADLSGCSLKHSKFQGADLRGADFTGSNLTTAYFSEADLRSAKGINWNDVIYIRQAIITQEQFDELPETIGGKEKSLLRFCIAHENAELTNLAYLQVRGTIDVEGTNRGAVVYGDPKTANRIGLLMEGTKVMPVGDLEMIKERGVWYRKVSPLPESEQEEPPTANELRVEGWVAGIYLMRVSTFV